ncbi:MAG: hypothetical protein NT033_10010 [Candidatus Omnitrophica bacterium]|nr:hypothetical protein [Candidatus Omnitrophota bacterium]
MPKDNIPPEERLLRLIRGQERTVINKDAPAPLPLQELKYQLKPDSRRPLVKPYLRCSLKNTVFIFLLFSAFYLAVVFFSPLINPEHIELPQREAQKNVAVQPDETKQNRQSIEHYLNAVRDRDIFVKQSAQVNESTPGIIAAELIKDMNLVGIISGVDPQAIIEDKKLQKTYYLRKGQFVGELQIQDIQKGRVIIGHNGEKYELYL